AGFTTRISTAIAPINAPYHHFPLFVNEADTGSVAINNIPKANPPNTKCQYQGIENIGLVSEPIRLNRQEVTIIPIITPAMIRQEAIRAKTITAAPMINARVETSPIEPGKIGRAPCRERG